MVVKRPTQFVTFTTGSMSRNILLRSCFRVSALTLMSLLAAMPLHSQQRRAQSGSGGEPPRDSWQRVDDIIAAMGNIAGKQVADVAAGQGYLTSHLARAVGRNGRVFAVEIGDAEVAQLQALAQRDSMRNIEVVKGTPTDPKLRTGLDAAVVLNSYHEFKEHHAMLVAIRTALKPGGLLVLVDNNHPATSMSRDEQASRHGLSPSFVEKELIAAGFEIVNRIDTFIDRPMTQQWMFVARRTK